MTDRHYQEDLEAAVRLVLEAGLATGHADNFVELMREVLDQKEHTMPCGTKRRRGGRGR